MTGAEAGCGTVILREDQAAVRARARTVGCVVPVLTTKSPSGPRTPTSPFLPLPLVGCLQSVLENTSRIRAARTGGSDEASWKGALDPHRAPPGRKRGAGKRKQAQATQLTRSERNRREREKLDASERGRRRWEGEQEKDRE